MPSHHTPRHRLPDVRRHHAPSRLHALGRHRASDCRPHGPRRLGPALAVLTALLLTALPLDAPRASAVSTPKLGTCEAGELCFWQKAGFRGSRQVYELAGTDLESCVPLPKGTRAVSFANRMGRPVTVYQSAHCDTTGEFSTYPSGSWTPEGEYAARAFTVWER